MIEAKNLTKKYGDKTAVDDLTFTVRPGIVTGFLGPNGAGKSTTMRMILGLDAPTGGTVTVGGRPYRQHAKPLQVVGALLEARAVHTSRSAYNHLLALAATHGIARSRVAEVIEMVGLQDVARKRAGGFSLGMGQRLGIASALLADPETLILDEPVNGLDPEGDPLDPGPAQGPGRGRAHRLRLQPPDERDGADGRARHRRRPGPADGRHADVRAHRAGVQQRGGRPLPAGRGAGRGLRQRRTSPSPAPSPRRWRSPA